MRRAGAQSDQSRVLVYSTILIIGSALLFGLAPALRGGRRDLSGAMKRPMPFARIWRVKLGLREMLVTAQVMLSVVSLACAGLFVRSLQHARTIDPGFSVNGAVALNVDPQLMPGYDSARTRRFYQAVVDRLSRLNGVRVVGRASSIPLDGDGAVRHIFIDDGPSTPERVPAAEFYLSSPGFFDALGIPMLEGHDFAPRDTGRAIEGVVINDALARRLWPHTSAIGKTLRIESPAAPGVRVIGVVRTANYRTIGERPRPALWWNLDRVAISRTTIVVRGDGAETALISAIRAAVTAVDPSIPVIGLAPLRDRVSVAYAAVVSGAAGASAFALIAALLTMSGIYGVVAYAVSQRQREIGVRSALGARPRQLAWLVVARSVSLTAAGLIIGLVIVALVPMGLDRMLYGVTSHDGFTLALTGMLFCTVAAAAAFIPARRAARMEPMRVLRLD